MNKNDFDSSECETVSLDEFFKIMHEKNSKKDFRNWINDHLPSFGGYNAFYNLTHPWEVVAECARQVKWAWQRVFRKWDDRVVWSIDWHLTEFMPQWLKTLKEIKHGTPCAMWEGMTPIDENWNYSEEDNEIAKKRWSDALDKMILGFESARKIQEYGCKTQEEVDEAIKIFEDGMDLVKKYFFNLWD